MNLRASDLVHRTMCAALVVAAIAGSRAIADEGVLVISPKIIEFYNGADKSLKPPRHIAVSADAAKKCGRPTDRRWRSDQRLSACRPASRASTGC